MSSVHSRRGQRCNRDLYHIVTRRASCQTRYSLWSLLNANVSVKGVTGMDQSAAGSLLSLAESLPVTPAISELSNEKM